MTNRTTFQIGRTHKFSANVTSQITWSDTKSIAGVKAWARDEATGHYVRVFETGPTEWVDNEPQAWSTGNFETVADAQRWASAAYHWINKNRRAAA